MSYKEVMEVGDDYYQMVQLHYLLTSEAERRNRLYLLAEEAITTEDEVAGVRPRESRRYPTSEWVLSKRDNFAMEVVSFPCLHVTRSLKRMLGKQERRSLCVRRRITEFVLDMTEEFGKLKALELKIRVLRCLNKNGEYELRFDMRSKPSIPTSKFVVSSSFEKTSSSGRGDEYNMIEEIINSGERSTSLRRLSGPRDGLLCCLNKVVYGLRIPLTFIQKGVMNVLQCCPAQLNGNVYEMMRVYKVLNEKWGKEGIAKQFKAEDVMAELELKYCSMVGMDPKQLDAEYYEHNFALTILLKGAKKYLEQKSQEFGALTARIEVQFARLKKFKDQSAHVNELEA
ncbi:hypothetical protein GIB67_021215 [Kingdonia uniflora]|uniref:Uncharacterized protein n=1 Tax=Kingdonia uniflora TaxID=39325 RepID=A0A7J7LFT9_9MAGN|nr:hypothetical protein GIB67_021215 [Kingdonia uniflora]